MSGIIGAFQPLRCHMGVNLSRRKTGVAKKGLNTAEIGSIIEQVRGKGVAQLVRAECRGESCLADIILKQKPDGTVTESRTAFIDKKRPVGNPCLMAIMRKGL